MSYDLRIVAITCAAAIACFALARIAERNWMPWLSRFAFVLMLAAGCYVIYSGVEIVRRGQQESLMTHPVIADLVRSAEGSRSALVLGIARNWAYGVILLGSSFVLQACKELFRSFRR
jgi:hypothetical protein